MELTNNRNASLARLLLITLPFVLLIGSSLPALFLLIQTWVPTIISGALMIIGWSTTIILRLTSVRFKFSEQTISVFYHPINPMTSNFKRIDIVSTRLLKCEIRTSCAGLRKELILYETISGQDASYPPVSINLCGKEMIRKVQDYLSACYSAGTSS